LEIAFFWIAFAVVVGVAASSRGRNGFGWFILALIISPHIGLLLVLVMDRKTPASSAPSSQFPKPFEPDGVLAGIPYRVMQDGSVEAILQGATVRFADRAKFSAATGATLPVDPPPAFPAEQKLLTLADVRAPPIQRSWLEKAGAEFSHGSLGSFRHCVRNRSAGRVRCYALKGGYEAVREGPFKRGGA